MSSLIFDIEKYSGFGKILDKSSEIKNGNYEKISNLMNESIHELVRLEKDLLEINTILIKEYLQKPEYGAHDIKEYFPIGPDATIIEVKIIWELLNGFRSILSCEELSFLGYIQTIFKIKMNMYFPNIFGFTCLLSHFQTDIKKIQNVIDNLDGKVKECNGKIKYRNNTRYS
jgi:hypothetical protein